MQNEVMEKLINIFREVFDDDEIVLTKNTTSKDIEDWDSLMNMTLVTAIEKEFNIKFKLKEVLELQNVGNMVELIIKKIS